MLPDFRAVLRTTLLGCAVALVAGCSSSPTESTGASEASGSPSTAVLRVVASTDVYADIIGSIGGDRVEATAFIGDAAQDPHSFEPSAQEQLAVKRARVVVQNGGGYDDFMQRLISSSGTDATVLDVVEISGRRVEQGSELNEHVWYDFLAMKKLVDATVSTLSAADAGGADTFAANGKAMQAQLDSLIAREAATKAAHGGAAVAVTEPLPGYLLEAQGLVNKTPADFSEAIEEGEDVSPVVLADTLALFKGKQVKTLVYNEQTSGPTTEQVLKAAQDNGVAVVPVQETLPEGVDYVSWMTGTLDAMDQALAGK